MTCEVRAAPLDHLSDVLSNLEVATMPFKQRSVGCNVADVSVEVTGVQAARTPRQDLHDVQPVAGGQLRSSGHDGV